MQRTREERRFLTSVYQNKQVRLRKQYDRNGHITAPQLGRWRTMSAFDCGRSACEMCCSPRKSKWTSKKEKFTPQENRNLDSFNYQLYDYFSG